MRLVYITNSINTSGGLERVLSLKANYLSEKLGYKIHIIVLNNGHLNPFYSFNASIRFHNIEVKGFFLKYIAKYAFSIRKELNIINPDVISVCDDGLKGLISPILLGKKYPIIYERHASIHLNFLKTKKNISKNIKYKLERKLMLIGAKKFDKFVILTNGNKKDWPNVSCTVIPNPNSYSNHKIDHVKKEKLVLAVGSQDYNKGYDRLIDIWKIVNQKYPDWTLKIYGNPKENLMLDIKIKELALTETIKLSPSVKNIHEIYQKTSIYAMTSRSEGFGMVLIEAMTFGVPCISFDCPHGPADIINDNVDGLIIENGNLEAFSTALLKLIEDENLRKKMGQQARASVKRYDIERIIILWDNLFKSLINKPI